MEMERNEQYGGKVMRARSAGIVAPRQKQLLFDRRYGWVYEAWTDPVEVANIGGRGMFSVLPLTAATLDGTLQLANAAATYVVKSLQNPHPASVQLFNSGKGAVDRANTKFRLLLHAFYDYGEVFNHHLKDFPRWRDSVSFKLRHVEGSKSKFDE